jgi:glycine oxidase
VKTYDVLVVGGGIIGCAIALELSRRKLRVAVLDRQQFIQEASWAAAGMLSPAPDCPAAIALVPLARASMNAYPQFVRQVEDGSHNKVGYRPGGTIEAIFHGDPERELDTLVTLHRGLGLACDPLPLADVMHLEPELGRSARAAAMLPDEASIDVRALGSAMLAAIQNGDVESFPNTEVAGLLENNGICGGVRTAAGETISAGQVVLAAGCWSSLIPGMQRLAPTSPVRGQMVALRNFGQPIRHVLRSATGYVVPRNFDHPQSLVGGSTLEYSGYQKRVTSGGIAQILAAVNELVPALRHAEISDTWSGLRPGTPDQLPIIGPTDIQGLTLATGHYRNGILLAPITANLIGDWIIEGRVSLDWEAFSPMRFAHGRSDSAEAAAQ